MKKHEKKEARHIHRNRFLFCIFIILFIIFLGYKGFSFVSPYLSSTSSKVQAQDTKTYKVIKQDENKHYLGIGQKKVTNQDGYFTTFTTQTDHQKTYKEYKQNGTSSWSSHKYWDATMEQSGCGITAIATLLSGYHMNDTPEDLRQKYYPVLNGNSISTELSDTFGIKNSDFYYDSFHLSNEFIENHLKTNRPILICVWTKPSSNRWTTASHYMLLLATDQHGMVYVSNPNGLENTSKSSGWYPINEVTPYIAKALFIESY